MFPGDAWQSRKRTQRSGQQILTIAQALMIGPRVPLIDEPSEGLAPPMGQVHPARFVRGAWLTEQASAAALCERTHGNRS
jgi:ABC-type molybdenum transport system ATPase subunit/photorepair protein PhrA